MIKGKEYNQKEIIQYSIDNRFLLRKYGSFMVGNYFISLINYKNNAIAFILIKYIKKQGIYECIYTDIK